MYLLFTNLYNILILLVKRACAVFLKWMSLGLIHCAQIPDNSEFSYFQLEINHENEAQQQILKKNWAE